MEDMVFKLEINCGNDAFAEDGRGELARILRLAAEECEAGRLAGLLRDGNGNPVGTYALVPA